MIEQDGATRDPSGGSFGDLDGIALTLPVADNSVLQFDNASGDWQNSAAQHLGTSDTPQFLRLGVGKAADTSIAMDVRGGGMLRLASYSTPGVTQSGVLGLLDYAQTGTYYMIAGVAGASSCSIYIGGLGFSKTVQNIFLQTGADGGSKYTRALVDSLGNVVIGSSALATDATDGFLYIPTCPGTPTGVPTTFTGRSALIYDSTNDVLYAYDGGWQAVHKPVLTTKGDLLTYGTAPERLPVGADGTVLTAQADGSAAWEALPASGFPGDTFELPFASGAANLWTVVTGSWSVVNDTSILAHYTLMGPATVNQEIKKAYFVVPSTGTWALKLLYVPHDDRGIAHIYIDGVEKGTVDMYVIAGSNPAWNKWSSGVSLGSLTGNTNYSLSIKAASKNASSSAYRLSLQKILVYRTA